MIGRAVFLHVRWFALFAFVALAGIIFGKIQDRDAGNFGDPLFWWSLSPTVAVCAVLAIVLPWAVFAIDPRRKEPLTLHHMLRYWKAI